MIVDLPDLAAMEAFGRRIAERLRKGDVVALSGGLGAGKTTLARAIVAALGYTGEVPSPTFTIVESYEPPAVRVPLVHADFYRLERPERGLVLIEDFGTHRMRDWLDANPDAEEEVYAQAIDALVALNACPPGPFEPYDMAVYQREAGLFVEWYCPAMKLDVDAAGWTAAWEAALAPLLPRQQPGVTVLRDYHAENIMLLPDGGQGLIDFQDALVGHAAYDLVSLLQDARRDVSPELERKMLDRYLAQVDAGPEFEADYARLGAQRNAKIVGIFSRLWKRDGKPRYLAMIPRVWEALERDLRHPALAPVAAWFDANIPRELRDTGGGELQ